MSRVLVTVMKEYVVGEDSLQDRIQASVDLWLVSQCATQIVAQMCSIRENLSRKTRGEPFLPLGEEYYKELEYFAECLTDGIAESLERGLRNKRRDSWRMDSAMGFIYPRPPVPISQTRTGQAAPCIGKGLWMDEEESSQEAAHEAVQSGRRFLRRATIVL